MAWRIAGATTYALEGSVFVGGAVIQWLRDELGLIRSAGESYEYAVKYRITVRGLYRPRVFGFGLLHIGCGGARHDLRIDTCGTQRTYRTCGAGKPLRIKPVIF